LFRPNWFRKSGRRRHHAELLAHAGTISCPPAPSPLALRDMNHCVHEPMGGHNPQGVNADTLDHRERAGQ
jgi:hypothetical protein